MVIEKVAEEQNVQLDGVITAFTFPMWSVSVTPRRLAASLVFGWSWLHQHRLSGIVIFLVVTLLSISTFIFVRGVQTPTRKKALVAS